MNQIRFVHRWVLRTCLVLATFLPGCYSFSTIQAQRDITAAIPVGSSGSIAFKQLQHQGYCPQYDGPKKITGRRTTGWVLIFCDWVDVWVCLDDAGKVKSMNASEDQNYP